MALVQRDPFARAEVHRHRVYVDGPCPCWAVTRGCAWCGQRRQTPRTGRAYLYRYTVQTDGGRTLQTGDGFGLTPGRLFCSNDCRRTYQS